MNTHTSASEGRAPWNKGKLVGQKAPLRISEIWAMRDNTWFPLWERRVDIPDSQNSKKHPQHMTSKDELYYWLRN